MLLHIYKERTDKLDLLGIAANAVNDKRKSFFGSYYCFGIWHIWYIMYF